MRSFTVPNHGYGESRQIFPDGLFDHRQNRVGRAIQHGCGQRSTGCSHLDGHVLSENGIRAAKHLLCALLSTGQPSEDEVYVV